MTWRGINLLALAAIALLVAAVGQAIAALLLESWWLMADACVCGLAGIGISILAVLEDVL